MNTDLFNVFIVDDDEDDRFFFEKALRETGFPANVLQVENAVELLSLLESATELPNIIFLDINMPLMDGLTALENIRSKETYRDVQIIIFSTSDNPSYVRTAYQRGAQLYLKKPDRYEDYILLLGAILTGRGEAEKGTKAFIR